MALNNRYDFVMIFDVRMEILMGIQMLEMLLEWM